MTYAPVVSHCDELLDALGPFRRSAAVAGRWGERLAAALCGGGRLLAAGNGGSAAQAQHLTAELVGRYRTDRPPFSAIALHADTSSTTAIANDYGVDELFARQVRAHGRPGDVLILLSTSGASANLLSAADAGRAAGLHVWALTGPAPNPLAAAADEAFCVDAPSTATVQELHLVAVHMICAAFDDALEADGLLDADGEVTTTHGTGIARSLSSHGAHADGATSDGSRSPRGAAPAPGAPASDRGGARPARSGLTGTPADGTGTASGSRPARDGAQRLDGVQPVVPDGAVGHALGRRGEARRPEEPTGRAGASADGPARRTAAFDGAPRSGGDGAGRPGGGGAVRPEVDGAPRPRADGTGRAQVGDGREAATSRGGTGRHRAVPGRGAGRKGRRDG